MIYTHCHRMTGLPDGAEEWSQFDLNVTAVHRELRHQPVNPPEAEASGWMLLMFLVCLFVGSVHGQTLGEALNQPNLLWTAGGTYGWSVTTNASADGVASAESPAGLLQGNENWIQCTAPASDAVTFWWKLDTPSTCEFLELFSGTNLLASCATTRDWHPRSVLLPAGDQALKWRLRRTATGGSPGHGWLDQVSFGDRLSPVILQQPTNQTALAGEQVNLFARGLATEPFWLQWLRNETNVPFATNETLTLTMQDPNAGDYRLFVTNLYGAVTSQVATVTVIPQPPTFTQRPVSQGVPPGGTAYFTAGAVGSEPMSWQWSFEGTDLPGATSAGLTLTNVLATGNGIYRVTVSNICGASSSEARLGYSSVGAWGWGAFGRLLFPPDTTNVVALAGGDEQYTGLKRDGSVVGWGRFGYPIGGTPNTAPLEATNAISIGAGSSHCLAARADGSVVLWGKIYASGSTNVPPSATNVAAVALGPGAQHAVALRSDGTVVDWGYSGVILPATLTNASAPNVVSVAGGPGGGLALMADGKVVGWGGPTPPPLMGPAVAIACGWYHGMAVMTNGTVVEWGSEYRPPNTASNVVAIAAGGRQSLALRRDGTLIAWSNLSGDSLGSVPTWATNIAGIACTSYGNLVALAEGPPHFTPPLVDRSVPLGHRMAIFSAVATGEAPISYQWRFNGTNLPSETNTSLVLRNLQASHLGCYSLVASNRLGTASTREASLTFARAKFRKGSTRVSNGIFYFTVDGPPQTKWWIQESTNGIAWSASTMVTIGATGSISASKYANASGSLYRLLWTP